MNDILKEIAASDTKRPPKGKVLFVKWTVIQPDGSTSERRGRLSAIYGNRAVVWVKHRQRSRFDGKPFLMNITVSASRLTVD